MDALKQLIGVDDRAAKRVYSKIEGSVNLDKWTTQDPKKRARASLLVGLFFVMMALIGLAYAAAISKPPSPVTSTPSPSAAITPSPVPSIPSPSATIVPSPVTSGAFPSATAPPSPVSSPTPLSEKAIRALWTPVIYHSLNSKLVESYIPDEVHAADLIDAIRDNEGLAELIEKFESKVNDDVLEKWFIDINFTLKNIQKDLQLVDHPVLDFPDVLRLYRRTRTTPIANS